jgi:tetratricopeptide (TPR) repeat protein
MKINKFLIALFIFTFYYGFGQQSKIYTNELVVYNHANELYLNKDYSAAQILFKRIKNTFDNASELKARSYYYEAFCAIKLGQKDGDELMKSFFEKYPTSTKRTNAYLEVSDYYFKEGKYAYALKWYSKVDTSNLSSFNKEEFIFNKAYSYYAVGSNTNAKKYFSELLDSPKYGSQAKYYYGFMAYKDDDFAEADKYLSESASKNKSDKDIDYFLVNIKFKTGKFQEAIDAGLPLLKKSNGIQKSELSKIIGESYFNMQEYEKAVPYLLEYKGKKGKWNNTDYYQLGYTYFLQEDYNNAMQWFTKIIDGKNAVSQNAYYHLADCYLKDHRKQEALNAFRNTKQMDFDADIKKDAWLNYAKLSYEIGNPYKKASNVIQEYIAAYPDEIDKKVINELLISAFITTKDFGGAVKYLENNKEFKNSEIYQKVTYLNGIQLFYQGKYEDAIHNFNLSLKSVSLSNYKSKAIFWKAESNYRINNFDDALAGFEEFLIDTESDKVAENKFIHYNLAYTYFKLKDYNKAGGHFDEYINSNPNNKQQLVDSYIRLGDCYFALSNYYKAIPPYQKAVNANDIDVDYAQFQIAMCEGLMGENDKKIRSLLSFTETNLKSTLRDNAFYELGNSYVKENETSKALEAYNNVVKRYRMSSFVPKSLVKQGLVYYNNDQNEKALSKYKAVIKDFPATEEAREAIANAKQIYIEMGKVDEFETLVKNADFASITDSELDDTMFASAEQFYLSNNYNKSIEGFQKYLKRFPNGIHALTSNYYLAESYAGTKQDKKSQKYYHFILDKGKNDYTNRSLAKVAQFYLENNNWEKALPLLDQLEAQTDNEQNLIFAQSNLMKGNYDLKNYKKAVKYAEIILKTEKIDPKIISDAKIIIARSAFETQDFDKAQDYFKKVENSATGELKAEAIYYDAYFKNQEGNYKISNQSVQKLASDFSSYKYWGGKGLIIMAKNFYELEDAYQATYILESVITKFSDYKDIVDEAKVELNKIKKKESKTNSSVIIENRP